MIAPVFFLLFLLQGYSQDTILNLSSEMIDEDGRIPISSMDGWLYRQGADIQWAQDSVDLSTWRKLIPDSISTSMVDANGKLEAWFRVKIKIDQSLEGVPLGISAGRWAALDVFMDGKLFYSFGTTGLNGAQFHEYNPINKHSVSVLLVPGKVYNLSVHVVDKLFEHYLAKMQHNGVEITSKSGRLSNRLTNFHSIPVISINAPPFNERVDFQLAFDNNRIVLVAVFFTICFLFILMLIQNPTDNTLRLITLASLIFPVLPTLGLVTFDGVSTFQKVFIYASWGTLFFLTSMILLLLLIAKVLKGKIQKYLKIYLIMFGLYGILYFINAFNLGIVEDYLYLLLFVLYVGFLLYFMITSWRHLKGAQWAVMIGLLLCFLLVIPWTYLSMSGIANEMNVIPVLGYAIPLIIPLSFVVYVSLRFKEIHRDEQRQAEEVLRLTNEKKNLLADQNVILEKKVNKRTSELKHSLKNLKATQDQLIHSAKMASMGELTAGIAHEIQNPLNFVNNFSELNDELIAEIREEYEKGNQQDVEVLLNDLAANEKKINEHGKRADSIVKNMLMHSRKGSDQKELTDINALADEYLRLAYHGMRAKDKSFQASFTTDFDPNLPKIKVVSQDIGRVFLNLINNAFQACHERKQKTVEINSEDASNDYHPNVRIQTEVTLLPMRTDQLGGLPRDDNSGHEEAKIENAVLISVSDNGPGIPKDHLDKIFQPFFTTKPTGQGTGLGLSLAYDIVTKLHGGELTVKTKEGEGTTFVISLPIS